MNKIAYMVYAIVILVAFVSVENWSWGRIEHRWAIQHGCKS